MRLATLLLLTCSIFAQSPPPATLLLPQMPLHDPWILANPEDKTYYLYTSNQPEISGTPGIGTMVYRSADLKHWQPPIIVFTAPPGGFGAQGGWAPEVHRYRGRYYLLTTLHDEAQVLAAPPAVWKQTYHRGTMLAVSDQPAGPFTLAHPGPIAPPGFMTLDGTLYLDRAGKPWEVYAHEWIQKIDGTIEAVPLTADLTARAGDPIVLFKGSDAPWLDAEAKASPAESHYVTDGPELFRTSDGHLLMLWSSWARDGYVQTVARSESGEITGPWEQLPPLLRHDSGHGMLFRTFDGRLMLVVHRPFYNARGKLYDIRDAGDHLELVRERLDLDGEPKELR